MTVVSIGTKPPPLKLSYSLIDTWMKCPLQARFQELDHLPRQQSAAASFGTCMHHAIEFYTVTHDIEEAIRVFKDVWKNPEKLDVVPDTWPPRQTFGGYMQRGIETLRAYHERLRWDRREVIAVEHKFCVPFGEFLLSGIVDLLEVGKDSKGREQLRIVDHKTNGRAPFSNNLRLNIQFSIYDYASHQPEFWLGNPIEAKYAPMENGEWWMEQLKDLPRRGIWHGLMQGKEYDAGTRDENDWMRLYRCCKEISKALKHEVFVPNISGESCTFCSYTAECRLPINPRDYDPANDPTDV